MTSAPKPMSADTMVERVARAMRKAMTAVDCGGEGSEFVAYTDIKAGARAAIEAQSDTITRLKEALEQVDDALKSVPPNSGIGVREWLDDLRAMVRSSVGGE